MKGLFFNLVIILSSIFSFNSDIPVSSSYYAKSYVVLDGYSGEILEGKDYHTIRSVASISKIMTAILAIESQNLFYVYSIPDEATNIEGSSVYLKENEEYRLIDLVYGLLLRSGNDAAYAISLCVEKTTEDFVDKMNEKAKKIGMSNSIFSNPCGLDITDEGNLSTAYDMAILMKYCMNNEMFREIIACTHYQFGNKVYQNKNKLLKSYDYLLGGKTGFTSKARRTLITAAEKENQYLIMCTLDCGSDYSFHKSMYESYFNTYQYIVFLNKGKNYIDEYLFISDQVIGMRMKNEKLKNAIKKYFINPITGRLVISIIDEEGVEYQGGDYSNVVFERITN